MWLVIALHFGEVTYGNIGSSDRVDFTVIGPAVNLVSRIEAIAKARDLPLIVRDDFARAFGYCAQLSSLGNVRAARAGRSAPSCSRRACRATAKMDGRGADPAGVRGDRHRLARRHRRLCLAKPVGRAESTSLQCRDAGSCSSSRPMTQETGARAAGVARHFSCVGGGSLVCSRRCSRRRGRSASAGVTGPSMQGWAASMTDAGFVALPDPLQAGACGPHAVAAGGRPSRRCPWPL